MPKKLIPFAICYDFDGTLAPGNMQERDFIPDIKMTTRKFWGEVSSLAKEHDADNILIYMGLMLDKAHAAKVQVKKSNFKQYGRSLSFFKGIEDYKEGDNTTKGWFDRINEYGKASGVQVEHYVISSGIREMVQGTKISSKFEAIFASSFWYDHHGVAKWPALALNYTTKTQYLFRINKGSLNVYDHKIINDYVPKADRKVPFENMIFIGDGETDIPCFRLVKDQGGHSIVVYKPHTRGVQKKADKLIEEGRANFKTVADYREGKEIDQIVKGLIDKAAHDDYLKNLSSRSKNKRKTTS